MRLNGLKERVLILETKKNLIDIYTDEYFQNMVKLMDQSMRGGKRPGYEAFEEEKQDFSLNNLQKGGINGDQK